MNFVNKQRKFKEGICRGGYLAITYGGECVNCTSKFVMYQAHQVISLNVLPWTSITYAFRVLCFKTSGNDISCGSRQMIANSPTPEVQ